MLLAARKKKWLLLLLRLPLPLLKPLKTLALLLRPPVHPLLLLPLLALPPPLVLLLTLPKALLTLPALLLLKLPRKLLTQLLPQSRSLNSQASRRVWKKPPQGGFFLPRDFCLKPLNRYPAGSVHRVCHANVIQIAAQRQRERCTGQIRMVVLLTQVGRDNGFQALVGN